MAKGKVAVAFLSPHTVSTDFANNMADLFRLRSQQIAGRIDVRCGGGITRGRNNAVNEFLKTRDDWLLFIDSDMTFTTYDFDLVLESAHADKRPIVGGLCFGLDGMVGPFANVFPTLFMEKADGGYEPLFDYPRNKLVKVDATGTAFLLIHRSALEKIAEHVGLGRWSWFGEHVDERIDSWVSEDVAFCERARAAGLPIYCHTGARIGHHKGQMFYLTEDYYSILRQSITGQVARAHA